MVNFGNRLKALRTGRRLTQKQLSEQIGIAVSAISSYESGTRYPSYDVLISLARIFHVSTDYLLGLDHQKKIDVSDLSREEVEVITHMVNILRKHNS